MTLTVGLTGGIGAGKSTVARLLAHQGASLLDADQLARELLTPGSPALREVGAAFGGVVGNGELDRAKLAARVFNDPAALARLEAILHPLIWERIRERLAVGRPGEVIVVDLPLLVERGWADAFDVVVVVAASEPVRRARLRARGMADADITARMANQADDGARRAVADHWIENDAGPAELEGAVAGLWQELVARAQAGRSDGASSAT